MSSVLTRNYVPVTFLDFVPFQKWEVGDSGKRRKYLNPNSWKFETSDNVKCYQNLSTKRFYRCEPVKVIRAKFIMLNLIAPLQIIKTVGITALRCLKIITGYHFWTKNLPCSSLKERFIELGKDVLKIVFAPILLVGLLLSGVYGVIAPVDGRGLYASYERALFNETKKQLMYDLAYPKCLFKKINNPHVKFNSTCEKVMTWGCLQQFHNNILNPPYHLAGCMQPLSEDTPQSTTKEPLKPQIPVNVPDIQLDFSSKA